MMISTLARAEISLAVDHQGALVLGDITEVGVTLIVPDPVETEARPLRVSVNVGSFSPIERVERGMFKTRYTLPATRHPQVALVAVWRETGPDAEVAFLRIPMSGRTTLPVWTPPEAEVRVIAGDAEFGPVRADAHGRANVPIVVPPGVGEVIATSLANGRQSQVSVSSGVPPYNRLTLAVTPYLIEADGQSSATVYAYYDVEGGPPPIDAVAIVAPEGRVEPVAQSGNVYRFRYTPARNRAAREAPLAVSVRGDAVSSASAVLSLGTPVPSLLVAVTGGVHLVADETSYAKVRVLVLDRLGLGVPGLAVRAETEWPRVSGVEDRGNGMYEVALAPEPGHPPGWRTSIAVDAESTAGVKLAKEIELVVHAPAWPVRGELATQPVRPSSDGESSFVAELVLFDAADRPFPGARLVVKSDAAEVSAVEELGEGRYRARVLPNEGIEAMSLAVSDLTGRYRDTFNLALRSPAPTAAVGAGAGIAIDRSAEPTVAIDLSYRPSWSDRRTVVYAAADYHRLHDGVALPVLPNAEASLDELALSLGLLRDLYTTASVRVYAGLGARFVVYEHDPGGGGALPVSRGIEPGAEVRLGGGWEGLFVELDGRFVPFATIEVERPRFGLGAVLGYRLGVL